MSHAVPPPLPARATMSRRPTGDGMHSFPTYVRVRARSENWEGPFYLFTHHWQTDLLSVLGQIRLCVKSNVPLGRGMDAMVQEGITQYKDWSPQRSTRMLKLAGFLFFAASALLTLAFSFGKAGVVFGAVLKLFIVCTWGYLSVFHRYQKPLAVFARLKAHLNSGLSLSESMARMPRFFPRNFVCLVEAGEETGNLEEILDGFNETMVNSIGAERSFAQTLRYLGFNFAVILSIASFMFLKSIPVFAEVLAELGQPVSSATSPLYFPVPRLETLINATSFLAHNAYLLPLGFLAIGVAILFWSRRGRGNFSSQGVFSPLLVVPGLRGLVVWQNLGSAARLLRHLLDAGMPLEPALAMVARGDLHPWYRRWFERIRSDVSNGLTLEQACANRADRKLVPSSFGVLLGMGESQGNLHEALRWIGCQYEEQFERRKRFLLGCLLPAGVMALGYLVLSLELAVFQALVDMSDALIE